MMRQADRAKQFMPFDAMKGLHEALREREERHLRTERRVIAEDMQTQISHTLSKIDRPTPVRIECYYRFHDAVLEGTVTGIFPAQKFLKLGDEKIWFEDLYAIEIIDIPTGVPF